MRLTAALLPVLAAANDPLYDWSASPLVQLGDDNFASEVTKDTKHVWVVEFYADWCGHCRNFAKDYEKAAGNLKGLVKFGAVNADAAKGVMQAAGVQSFPSIKVYPPEVTRNPYTGKMMKAAVDYNGPRRARPLVDFATSQLPSFVTPVTDKTAADFKANGTLPKALLFTSKTETTPMFKAFSLSLRGRMLLGEAREKEAAQTAVEMGVASYPALLVLPGGDAAPVVYDGELKPQAVADFLAKFAAEEAAAPEDAAGGAAPGAGEAEASLALDVSEDNVAELVTASKGAWLLAFEEEKKPLGTSVQELAEALYGQVSVGKASASLAKTYGVKKLPGVAVLPYGTGAKAAKKAQAFGGDEEGVAAAKKAALETIPDNLVEKLTSANMDQWLGGALNGAETKAICLLFSDKPAVPPLFRSLSIEFEGKLGFGMATASDKNLMANFGVKKVPSVLILFPDMKQEMQDGKAAMQGMQFTPQVHGKFNFGNLANFVAMFVTQKLQEMGLGDGSEERPRAQQEPRDKKMPSKKDLGPLPELSAATFEAECKSAGGLCAIALLDGAPENANKEAHLEMLTQLRKRKAGGPLTFSWIDATCHVGFASHFELSEMDLPALVVMSPSKLRWARNVGAFDAESLAVFGAGVASGRQRTEEMKALPPIEEVDCATVPRGGAAVEEEEPLGDDILAEILEEERREREARGLAEAEAAPAEEEKQDTKDMTELQKMESQLESCEATDLMCVARNDKLQKQIDKKRALEEKLAAIAKKKKKAKKKAKKAAKA